MPLAQIFIASTAHIKPATLALLDGMTTEQLPFAGGAIPHGWFAYAHDENDGTIPDDLYAVMEHARRQGAEYVRLDCDADPSAGLMIYDHEPFDQLRDALAKLRAVLPFAESRAEIMLEEDGELDGCDPSDATRKAVAAVDDAKALLASLDAVGGARG